MSKLARVRMLPWGLTLQVGVVAARQWRSLSRRDRARLSHLVGQSRGWPGNLTAHEREEVLGLLAKLDLKRAGRDLVPVLGSARRRRRG